MTWLEVQALSKQYYMLFCNTFWGIFWTLKNKVFTNFYKKLHRRCLTVFRICVCSFSQQVSATTCHIYRLFHSISLGQIRVSLAIAIAFKRFAQRSEEGSSPTSLKDFSKGKLITKVLILIWFWKVICARFPRKLLCHITLTNWNIALCSYVSQEDIGRDWQESHFCQT